MFEANSILRVFEGKTPSLESAFDMPRLEQYFSVHWFGTHNADLYCEGGHFYLKSDSNGICIQRLLDNELPPMTAGMDAFMKAYPTMKARRELIVSCLTPVGVEYYQQWRKYRRAKNDQEHKVEVEKANLEQDQDLSVGFAVRKRELGMSEALRLLKVVEGLSKILYHYTSLNNLYSILSSNQFLLSNSASGNAEKYVMPGAIHMKGQDKGDVKTIVPQNPSKKAAQKFYYFSTARSPLGRYQGVHDGAVELVLDGDKLAQRYQGLPVDYWGNGFRDAAKGSYEQEDRIFSKDPTIPKAISYIKEVHVLFATKNERDYGGAAVDMLRQCWLISKKNNIPFYVYDDRNAFKILDRRRALPVTATNLKPSDPNYLRDRSVPDYPVGAGRMTSYKSMDRDRNKHDAWLELYYKSNIKDLSKAAKYRLDNLNGHDDLSNLDLHKATATGYKEDAKLIKLLQKEGFTSMKQLADMLRAKWDKIKLEDRRRDDRERQDRMEKDVQKEIEKGTSLASILRTIQSRYGFDTQIKGDDEFEEFPTLEVRPMYSDEYSKAKVKWALTPAYWDQVEQYRQSKKENDGSDWKYAHDNGVDFYTND